MIPNTNPVSASEISIGIPGVQPSTYIGTFHNMIPENIERIDQKYAAVRKASGNYKENANTAQIINLSKLPLANNRGVDGEQVGQVEIHAFNRYTGFASEGTILFKPVEARFDTHSTIEGRKDIYLKIDMENTIKKSPYAKINGGDLAWTEGVKLKYSNQDRVTLVIRDNSFWNSTIATSDIALESLIATKKYDDWVPLIKNDEIIGELHIQMEFEPVIL